MISDIPRRGGREVKKGQIFANVFYGWPPRKDLSLPKCDNWSAINMSCKIFLAMALWQPKYVLRSNPQQSALLDSDSFAV